MISFLKSKSLLSMLLVLISLGGCKSDAKDGPDISFAELVESKAEFTRKEVQVIGCVAYYENYRFYALLDKCNDVEVDNVFNRIVLTSFPASARTRNGELIDIHLKKVRVNGVFFLDDVGLMSMLVEDISVVP